MPVVTLAPTYMLLRMEMLLNKFIKDLIQLMTKMSLINTNVLRRFTRWSALTMMTNDYLLCQFSGFTLYYRVTTSYLLSVEYFSGIRSLLP